MIDVQDDIVLEIRFNVPALNVKNAGDMLELLIHASDANAKNIVLNMNSVRSIDSTAIANFVKFVQHLSGTKRAMAMSNVNPEVLRVLEMLKLRAFFKVKEKRTSPS